jgi:hypothetical protein
MMAPSSTPAAKGFDRILTLMKSCSPTTKNITGWADKTPTRAPKPSGARHGPRGVLPGHSNGLPKSFETYGEEWRVIPAAQVHTTEAMGPW